MNNYWQQVPYVVNQYDHRRPWGFGRPFGFGFGLPLLGGLAAGALLGGAFGGYGYGYPYYTYPYYGYY
jgi:hypothetical protein